jgi:diguanylate cyclase (GGDEF)-like protein/PAS domain S-box-containing protein
MWDWDISNDKVFFSPQLKRMLGYGPDEMQPVVDTWKNNIHPDDMSHVMTSLKQHLNDETTRFEAEYRLKNRNQVYIWVHDQGKICERDLQNRPTRVVGMVQNISERKSLEDKLTQLANTDQLTNLANRRAGATALDRILTSAKLSEQPLCIAFIDLDHFKIVNDNHGHHIGDLVLKSIASVISISIRHTDFACRWGGEEFVVVLPNTTIEQSLRIVENIHKCTANIPWQSSLSINPITLSIGVASYPQDHHDTQSILTLADNALYAAKSQGRNRTCFAKDSLSNE